MYSFAVDEITLYSGKQYFFEIFCNFNIVLVKSNILGLSFRVDNNCVFVEGIIGVEPKTEPYYITIIADRNYTSEDYNIKVYVKDPYLVSNSLLQSLAGV